MDNNTTVHVSRASDSQAFVCSICIIDKEEKPVLIDNNKICVECITDYIVPKFHEALKFEINYPVEWSTGVTLHPKDFAEFFDDYKSFDWEWRKKEREYETPGPDRLHCKNVGKGCEAFIGDRTYIFSKTAFCPGCREWVCKDCGRLDAGKHECNGGAQEELPEELKDHKRCPGCRALIDLQDGCNLVRCQLGSCGMEFCYICLAVRPSWDHFSRGNPCPKFGKLTDDDALFAEDVLEQDELEEGEIEDDEVVDGVDDTLEQERSSLIRWAIDVHQMGVLLKSRDKPEDLPVPMAEALPIFAVVPTAAGRLLDAHLEAVQLLSDPAQVRARQVQIVADHRQLLQSIVDAGVEMEDDLRHEGLLGTQPTLPADLQGAAMNLIPNLELYLDPDAVHDAFKDFYRRHGLITAFLSRNMSGDLFHWWPAMYAALRVYIDIAPDKLAAAAPHVDGGDKMPVDIAVIEDNEWLDMDESMSDVGELEDSGIEAGGEFADEDEEAFRERMADNGPAARLRKEHSMRIYWRKVTLNAMPPSRPGRDENGYITGAQTDIMEDDRANAQSLVDTVRDLGARWVFGELLDFEDRNAEEKEVFVGKFVAAAEKLAVNVDLYTHFDRIRNAHAEYAQRHEDIITFWKEDMPRAEGFFDLEPDVSSAFFLYSMVAGQEAGRGGTTGRTVDLDMLCSLDRWRDSF